MPDHRLEIVLAAKDVTQAAFSQAQRRMQAMTKSIFSLKGAIAGLTGVYELKQLADGFLDTAKSFEQMRLKLDALTRGKGKETLEALNKWALEMPVNTQKAIDTFVMMKAMGLDPTLKSMETLVNVAVTFGEEAMPRVARALGQMKTLGKLSAEELNQLAEAGINARKYLRDAFGMSVQEIQKAGISIDQVIKAIMQGLERDFGGAARAAMNNWQGLTAAFQSYITEIQREIMEAGVFDELKAQLKNINEQLADWIKNNRVLIRQKVPEYIEKLKSSIRGLVDIYKALPDDVIGATGVGLVGRILFGGKAGGLLAVIYFIKQKVDDLQKWLDKQVWGENVPTYDWAKKQLELSQIFAGGRPSGHGAGGSFAEKTKKQTKQTVDSIKDQVKALARDLKKEEEAHIKEQVALIAGGLREEEKDYQEFTNKVKRYQQEAIQSLGDTQYNAAKALEEALADPDAYFGPLKEATKTVSKEAQEQYQHMMEKIQDATADTFYDIFTGVIDSWKDLWNRAKDYFLRVLAEMAAKAATTRIIVPITAVIFSGSGQAHAATGGGGSAPGFGFITHIPGIGGFLNTPVLGTAYANNVPGAWVPTWGQVLGAAGLGSLGYGTLGNWIGLPQSKYSPFTSGAGAGLGFAVGGPIGAGIGALIGGTFGGLFGHKGAKKFYMNWTGSGFQWKRVPEEVQKYITDAVTKYQDALIDMLGDATEQAFLTGAKQPIHAEAKLKEGNLKRGALNVIERYFEHGFTQINEAFKTYFDSIRNLPTDKYAAELERRIQTATQIAKLGEKIPDFWQKVSDLMSETSASLEQAATKVEQDFLAVVDVVRTRLDVAKQYGTPTQHLDYMKRYLQLLYGIAPEAVTQENWLKVSKWFMTAAPEQVTKALQDANITVSDFTSIMQELGSIFNQLNQEATELNQEATELNTTLKGQTDTTERLKQLEEEVQRQREEFVSTLVGSLSPYEPMQRFQYAWQLYRENLLNATDLLQVAANVFEKGSWRYKQIWADVMGKWESNIPTIGPNGELIYGANKFFTLGPPRPYGEGYPEHYVPIYVPRPGEQYHFDQPLQTQYVLVNQGVITTDDVDAWFRAMQERTNGNNTYQKVNIRLKGLL